MAAVSDSDSGHAAEGLVLLHAGVRHTPNHPTPPPPAVPAAGPRTRSPRLTGGVHRHAG